MCGLGCIIVVVAAAVVIAVVAVVAVVPACVCVHYTLCHCMVVASFGWFPYLASQQAIAMVGLMTRSRSEPNEIAQQLDPEQPSPSNILAE